MEQESAGVRKIYCITRKDQFQLREAVESFVNNDDVLADEVHYMYAAGNYIAFVHYFEI